MIRYLLIGIVVLGVAAASAEKYSFQDGKISFEGPESFTRFSQEQIDIKYPSKNAPDFVIGNENGATSIAYALKKSALPKERLKEAQEAFTQMFPRMIPGLKWIENKIIKVDEREWIYLELTSTAIDTDIHNMMLFTSYRGKLLAFNFNSTKEEFKKYEERLRKSMKSISIKE